jgi:hypothetical protein
LVAVVIGLIAIWGYHAIKDEAEAAAVKRANLAVDQYLKGPDQERRIRELVAPIIEAEVAKAREGLQLAYSQPLDRTATMESKEGTKPVAEPYPEEGVGPNAG